MSPWKPLNRLPSPIELVRQFTPNWFTVNMGTGITFLLLAQFPARIAGLHALAYGLFIADAAIFALFTGLFAARWLFFTQDAMPLLRHPVQSMFLGAIPMALIPLVNGLVLFHPGQPAAAELATHLWWIDAALSLLTGWLVPWYQFTAQDHSLERMTGVWLLPVVPAEVAASSAGYLAQHLPAAQAQALIVSGYALWGMSVPIALGILTVLYLRLALHKLPPKELGVSTWLSLGPIGTGAFALLTLGAAAPQAFAGTVMAPVAALAGPLGVIGALILWGLGLWWLVTAIALTAIQVRRGLPFNLGWWGFTFPVGVYTAASLTLGLRTGMAFFTAFAATLIVALVAAWAVVAVRSAHGLWHGHLVQAPCLNCKPELPAKTA
ncbi:MULTISPECIES: TDT family transporter [Thiomonas]|jgi:C4-dicarboxylate transporter/malic acid transport protein|uniref:TDT family transporter n=1 Tax=Thiomonas TaxID=32012 RepID=UPI000ACB1D6B|nr:MULTISPECIES: TDT family transporter [Thiomonas]HML82283.1 TDT family transporter [Thiomonas arsenitoxydans]